MKSRLDFNKLVFNLIISQPYNYSKQKRLKFELIWHVDFFVTLFSSRARVAGEVRLLLSSSQEIAVPTRARTAVVGRIAVVVTGTVSG